MNTIRTTTLLAAAMLAATAAAQDKQAPATKQPSPLSLTPWHPKRPTKEEDYQVARWGPRGLPSPGYVFRAKKILPVTQPPIDEGAIVTKNGKIEAIGRAKDIAVPAGYEVIECGDTWLVPGFVDLHCHIASESFDLNDTVHPTNPEFRTLDLITMEHDQIRMARAGGVTSVLYIPGSGSNMGGFGTLTKTWGKTPDEALIRFPGSLKIAQAGNPEREIGRAHV